MHILIKSFDIWEQATQVRQNLVSRARAGCGHEFRLSVRPVLSRDEPSWSTTFVWTLSSNSA